MSLKINKKILIWGIVFAVAMLIIGIAVFASISKESNAIKTIQSTKDSPEKLANFLIQLEQDEYLKESIKTEVSFLDFTIEEKLLIYSASLKYYTIPGISKDEIETYVRENGTHTLYMEVGKGGYYDGEEDIYSYDRIGLDDSPLYDVSSIKYFGDFFQFHEHGVQLNERYQEESYSNYSFYFKEDKIEFDPRNYECYYSGKYLFGIGSSEIYIYDTEAKKNYKFIQENGESKYQDLS